MYNLLTEWLVKSVFWDSVKYKNDFPSHKATLTVILQHTVIFLQPVDTPPSLLQATGAWDSVCVWHCLTHTHTHTSTSWTSLAQTCTLMIKKAVSLTNTGGCWKLLDLQLDAFFPTQAAALHGVTSPPAARLPGLKIDGGLQTTSQETDIWGITVIYKVSAHTQGQVFEVTGWRTSCTHW